MPIVINVEPLFCVEVYRNCIVLPRKLKRGWSSGVIHSGRDGHFKGSYATQSTVKESLAGLFEIKNSVNTVL